tara:strand:+ start:59920 stop:60102 length:183 start_codon:yes stop_codon:yes gene_type:complete
MMVVVDKEWLMGSRNACVDDVAGTAERLVWDGKVLAYRCDGKRLLLADNKDWIGKGDTGA